MACPLCDNESSVFSWLGTTHYNNHEFEYVQCRSCKSLYCQPMPDDETLARMYGRDYFKADGDSQVLPHDPDNRFEQPVAWLKENSPALLLDYGCGAGELLEQAQKLKWRCAGVEFDRKVAEAVACRLNIPIVTKPVELGNDFKADVLHLGDVVEHLTDLNKQMPEILELLKPGGILLAQGPLEANASLFTFFLKQSRKFRGQRRSEMPPYHVMLATIEGQKKCFERFGCRRIQFKVTEVAHPAPEKINLSDLRNLQKTGLFTARKISQTFSLLNPKSWGNRYFYVGQYLRI